MEQLRSLDKIDAGSDAPLTGEPGREPRRRDIDSHEALFSRTVRGLDSAVGLRRAMGIEDLYLSMLRSFADNRRDSAEQIRAALSLQDTKKAEHLSHSLFGISAQIGALRVSDDARELEDAICAGRLGEAVGGLLLRLEASLADLIESLESALPPTTKEI